MKRGEWEHRQGLEMPASQPSKASGFRKLVGASSQLSSGQPSPAAGRLNLMALEVLHSSSSGDARGPVLLGCGPGTWDPWAQ